MASRSAFGEITPFGNYTIQLFWTGNEVGRDIRGRLTDEFDQVARTIWGEWTDFYKRLGDDLFTAADIVILLTRDDRLVGFSVARRLSLMGKDILFRRYSSIYESERGNGLYRKLTEMVLQRELKGREGSFYLAWRTRSPLVWFTNAALCSRTAPAFGERPLDTDLVDLGVAVSKRIYPALEIDPATMTVKNVYPGSSGYLEQPKHRDRLRDASFQAHPALIGPHDSILGIGELKDSLVLHYQSEV